MPVASRTFSSQEVPHSPFPVSCKYSTAVASTSQPPQPSSGYPPLSIGQWGGQPRDCAVQKAALALPGNEAGVHCTNSQFGHPPTLEEPQPAICSVLVMCMLLMVVIEIKVDHVTYHLTPLKMRLGPSRTLDLDLTLIMADLRKGNICTSQHTRQRTTYGKFIDVDRIISGQIIYFLQKSCSWESNQSRKHCTAFKVVNYSLNNFGLSSILFDSVSNPILPFLQSTQMKVLQYTILVSR